MDGVVEKTAGESLRSLIISLIIFSLGIFFLFMLQSNAVGYVASWILNTAFLRRRKQCIKLGSFEIGILSGKIVISDVSWTTPDLHVSIVQLEVRIRWWKRCRDDVKAKPKDQSRLSVYALGLHMDYFNNTGKYKELEHLLTDPDKQHKINLDNFIKTISQAQPPQLKKKQQNVSVTTTVESSNSACASVCCCIHSECVRYFVFIRSLRRLDCNGY